MTLFWNRVLEDVEDIHHCSLLTQYNQMMVKAEIGMMQQKLRVATGSRKPIEVKVA